MNSAPAWSTIATGLDPGRHGIFYFDEPVPGTYRRSVLNAARRNGASLWRMASDAGKRIVVVNVPISYPVEPVNGVQVAGLDAPFTTAPGFSYPQDLTRRYPDVFGGYIIEPGAQSAVRAGRIQEAKDQLLRAIEGWVSLTARLMQDEEWDLVFVVFTSSDIAQHFFWAGEGYAFIERVYEAQDQATGRLVELAQSRDPDVNVVVLADHGGAANSRGPEFMPIWLEDQGLQVRTAPPLRSRALAAGFRVANRTLTRNQKLALARRFPRLRQQAEAEARLAGIDWRRTRAYADGRRDEVLLNLAGREPEGTVDPGAYEAVGRELKELITGIRELDTGRPVVDSVLLREEAYRGTFVDRAPDLTVRWVLDGPARGFECRSAAGRATMRAIAARPPLQSGGHHPDGLFVAKGPDVLPTDVRGDLADVTPTLLALLGAPVPAGLDGRPLDVVKGAVGQPSAPSEVPAPDAALAEPPSSGYSAEEEEEVRRRLEDLGYL
jgi:predicted AlkP superfamily phosphohydrolase/phosphomutase